VTEQVPTQHDDGPFAIDREVAQPARIYDYLLGGHDNFAADRAAADHIFAAVPGGVAAARCLVQAASAFMTSVARYVTGEAGVRQFLNVGTPIPLLASVHEIAQQVAPDSRVVYVVRDPVVLAHARRLLKSSPEGATSYIHSDLRDPPGLMRQAAMRLDLSRPVAVVLLGTLAYIADERDPHRIVRQLLEPVASGSHLAITHVASDIQPEVMAEARRRRNGLAQTMGLPWVPRSRRSVERFFDGLDLVGPGVVEVDRWQPSGARARGRSDIPVPGYAALGRKR
jgi:hypothetical protein